MGALGVAGSFELEMWSARMCESQEAFVDCIYELCCAMLVLVWMMYYFTVNVIRNAYTCMRIHLWEVYLCVCICQIIMNEHMLCMIRTFGLLSVLYTHRLVDRVLCLIFNSKAHPGISPHSLHMGMSSCERLQSWNSYTQHPITHQE